MAAGAKPTPRPKYSMEAQAVSLFAFLKLTFSKMPKAVQVFGWIVFLFLFVFLVLYPIVGSLTLKARSYS